MTNARELVKRLLGAGRLVQAPTLGLEPEVYHGLLSDLADILERLGGGAGSDDPEGHRDGPFDGRYLQWQGKRYDIKTGVVYRLLDYMWTGQRRTPKN